MSLFAIGIRLALVWQMFYLEMIRIQNDSNTIEFSESKRSINKINGRVTFKSKKHLEL